MRYKLLGPSGLRVSELCLGTMTFGDTWGGQDLGWSSGMKASRAVFDAFADAGGNFLDTADLYADGVSERTVGEFVGSERDHFVIASKYSLTTAKDVARGGNSRRSMMQCVDASLKRLGTDRIDLYYMHIWDFTTPIEEVMRAFDDLVRAGKILYIAASDTPAWRIAQANMLADLRGWAPFIATSIRYHLLDRTPEHDILPMARELGLGVTVWSPLATGILSGKYVRGNPTGPNRHKPGSIPEASLSLVKLVVEIADEIGRSASQVALAYIRQQSHFGTLIPIVGAREPEQLKDNMACIDLVLEQRHLDRLDAATNPTPVFPHDVTRRPYLRSLSHGSFPDQLDNQGAELAANRLIGH